MAFENLTRRMTQQKTHRIVLPVQPVRQQCSRACKEHPPITLFEEFRRYLSRIQGYERGIVLLVQPKCCDAEDGSRTKKPATLFGAAA